MITLKSPIQSSRTIVGFEVNEYGESPGFQNIRASVRVYFDDKTSELRDLTLWSGAPTQRVPVEAAKAGDPTTQEVKRPNSYADAGQWTDESAAARIAELLAQ